MPHHHEATVALKGFKIAKMFIKAKLAIGIRIRLGGPSPNSPEAGLERERTNLKFK